MRTATGDTGDTFSGSTVSHARVTRARDTPEPEDLSPVSPAPENRWPLIVAMLHSPDVEGRRLAALLDRLATERLRHQILDDSLRRASGQRLVPPEPQPMRAH
jgi:hypothetical protein